MKPEDIPIVTPEQAAQLKAELPPPGAARQEELARRKDALEEAKETHTPEAYAFDPAKLDLDREIAAHLNRNELDVTNAQPSRRYCWVFTGQQGKEIMAKKKDGWEPVCGPDPEALELKAVDGTRRLGDVMLMWVDPRKFAILEAVDQYRRNRQQAGVVGNLRDLADHSHGKVILHEDDGMTQIAAQRAAIRQQAMGGVDRMLREGTVPGLPTYGK